jgi:hypothetical protein
MSCEPLAAGAPACRIRYSKVAGGCLHYVIVDVRSDGGAEFWSQEAGEVRWYSYHPAPAERLAALSLRRPAGDDAGWPLLWP